MSAETRSSESKSSVGSLVFSNARIREFRADDIHEEGTGAIAYICLLRLLARLYSIMIKKSCTVLVMKINPPRASEESEMKEWSRVYKVHVRVPHKLFPYQIYRSNTLLLHQYGVPSSPIHCLWIP